MSIVRKYKSVVVSKTNPVSDIYTAEFRSLSGKYKFQPGQFLHLAIDSEYDGSDQWPISRCFSMQSNPDEQNIRITYAVKGYFTRMMKEYLQEGSEVWLKLPYGDLFQKPHNKVNTVFIAGGTGITPFLSLFTYRSFREYVNPRIYLGFRTGSYFIYDREMHLIQSLENNVHSGIKVAYEDVQGRLDIDRIFLENGKSPDYFISGPVEMINSFRSFLLSRGLKGDQIFSDDWE
jgi:ferredoxin-NADP reductase